MALVVFSGLLIICTAGFAYHRHQVTRSEVRVTETDTTTVMDIGALRSIQLTDASSGKQVVLDAVKPTRLRLLVFLSAADCPACLGELPQWNLLQDEFPPDQLQIVLVMIDSSPSEIRTFLDNYKPTYTVLVDSADQVTSKVHMPPKTPVSVLVGGDYTVKLVQGPTNDYADQQTFISLVRQFAKYHFPK